MLRFVAFITLLISSKVIYAQKNILEFKKGRKAISRYWEGSEIGFLGKEGEWEKGIIKKLKSDSIYIQPSYVRYYPMGTDTITLNTFGFSIDDICAMPKKGMLIDYKNGSFQINRAGGHVHFYWIKSGTLFRYGAAAYVAVSLINGINSENKITGEELAISAGVFAFGVLLKCLYKPYLKIGRKYHLEVLSI
jgi:hypothetical protein